MKSVRISLTGFSELQRFALEQMLLQSDLKRLPEFVNENELRTAEFHICSASDFVRHIEFFMPRKNRVAILVDGNGRHNDLQQHEITIISESERIEHIGNKLAKAIDSSAADENPINNDLTQREKQVLKLIASGLTIKEVASELDISVNTALTHRKNISAKLGIRSVSGLSLYAMINGLL